MYVWVKNKNLWNTVSSCNKWFGRHYFHINGFSTRYDNDFHLPSANLKLFQKGAFYSGIKTYSHLSKTVKELSHGVKQKRFIISNSFYSLEEYFDFNWKWVMFCYTGYTAPCKMACWLLILKLFIFNMYKVSLLYTTYSTDTNFSEFTNVYTVCCCFFFLYYYKMTIPISCKRSTENEWINEWKKRILWI
jgi:hypothetical protein